MSTTTDQNTSEELDLNEIMKPYLKKWYWFVFSAFVMVLLTFLYLKTQQSAYKITSTVLIKDAKNMNMAGDLGPLANISSLGKISSDGVDNEVLVFQSKTLMSSVVKELGLETSIWQPGFFRNTELYKDSSPIIVKVLSEKKDAEFFKKPIQVQIKGNRITLSSPELKKDLTSEFGKTISLPFVNIMILKNQNYDSNKTDKEQVDEVLISLVPFDSIIEEYQKLLSANLANKDVTVIELSMKYPQKQKAMDILNKLVSNYNRDALVDRNKESKETADFIEGRITQIGQDLGNVETEKEQFKLQNKITDIATEAGLGIQQNAQIKSRLVELENQIDLTNTLLGFINRQGASQVLPANTGLDNGSATAGIETYNSLIMERSRLLQNATVENPLVEELTKQIKTTRALIVESLTKGREGLLLTRSNILGEQDKVTGRITKIPAQEKMFRSIERQQQIKESLYLLLLQKREETNITLAMKGQKGRIIDLAYASLEPVAPKKIIILLGGLVVGLFIPFAAIYLMELLNDKVKSKTDLEKLTQGKPVVGEIPSLKRGEEDMIQPNDLSPMAEAFRILFTNLNYILPKKESGKVILVTSTVKGEGKTFVSVNLSLAIASPKRRTIIVGSDIRNPQLQRYNKESKNYVGLTEYLHDTEVSVESIIRKSRVSGDLDVIFSGMIPPNPTELLNNGRYKKLVEILKERYDYIILDTAPLMLVTDTLLVADVADITLYVSRSGVTERNLIGFANTTIDQGKIKNAAFVLNDVNEQLQGYGRYGYGYHATEKKWWQRLFE